MEIEKTTLVSFDSFEQLRYDIAELKQTLQTKDPLFTYAMAEYRKRRIKKEHPGIVGFQQYYARIQVICLDRIEGVEDSYPL